jgi:hypothetical protein
MAGHQDNSGTVGERLIYKVLTLKFYVFEEKATHLAEMCKRYEQFFVVMNVNATESLSDDQIHWLFIGKTTNDSRQVPFDLFLFFTAEKKVDTSQ